MTTSLILLAGIGAAGGLLAGLLGIGGGLVFVPALYFLLSKTATPDPMMQAVATSLAASTLTGASSARAHAAARRVNWDSVRRIAPLVVVGAAIGAWLAARVLDGGQLQGTVAALLLFAAFVMLKPARRSPAGHEPRQRARKRGLVEALISVPIGIASSVMGIAGGTWLVPMQTATGVPVHRAVATAAVTGVVIAAAGMTIMALTTRGMAVQWHALAPMCVASVLCAPLGANLSHRLPARRLRQVFAFFLATTSIAIIGGID